MTTSSTFAIDGSPYYTDEKGGIHPGLPPRKAKNRKALAVESAVFTTFNRKFIRLYKAMETNIPSFSPILQGESTSTPRISQLANRLLKQTKELEQEFLNLSEAEQNSGRAEHGECPTDRLELIEGELKRIIASKKKAEKSEKKRKGDSLEDVTPKKRRRNRRHRPTDERCPSLPIDVVADFLRQQNGARKAPGIDLLATTALGEHG
jgi:hypothetical protein